MPEGKAIDLNYSDLKEDYDVLLRNFEKEKRLKNLFILKVATDVENIKRTTDTKEQEDLLIHEKRIMFGYFGEDFDEDIGIPH